MQRRQVSQTAVACTPCSIRSLWGYVHVLCLEALYDCKWSMAMKIHFEKGNQNDQNRLFGRNNFKGSGVGVTAVKWHWPGLGSHCWVPITLRTLAALMLEHLTSTPALIM
eukprot:1139732-Pelagomonas_calceolata.AAC.7